MEEFPSNSHKQKREKDESKTPEKKITPVVTGKVQRRKTPLRKRFSETFTGADSHTVMDYLIFDVAIPAMKETFADLVTQGVERKLFGESRSRVRSRASRRDEGMYGHVAYNRYSSSSRSRRDDPRERPSRRARATHDFDEIILESRVVAEEVIDNLFEIISKYEVATVRDLYDLVGETADYTDEKWGWTDLRGAGVTRLRAGGGYLLDLPRPVPVD